MKWQVSSWRKNDLTRQTVPPSSVRPQCARREGSTMLGCQWESRFPVSVTDLTGVFLYSSEEHDEHRLGKASHKTSPFLFTVWHTSEGDELQERTTSVTLPFVRLRMATASSWVTPSRLCPLTAMIWSPLFRRPSSEAAPCNDQVGLFTQKMLTAEKDLSQNLNCFACARTLLLGPHGCSTVAEQWGTYTKEVLLLNDFSHEMPIWERI